ncbi:MULTISPECIES: hypothetical protein [Nitrosomonas]|uniref:hypothetical protein n=1 Tax=Nitrosomonas TaxID=914 RepID=UPI00089201FB|nr:MULTISPECIES: hypothetical protein [Nitrosomonas]MXS79895.1 hypothetical protein [Nitrosomonas sp. GH22]SCX10190.1 hypothetical protein SAMN05216379_10632 [Nitrosomonas eutropha]SDW03440.1 hypothetical protein SAMN05216317_101193 [Nitrosomonas eutropha]SEI77507.1 hypothetical protein SAMN05216318_1116 [Nitrosomonas eutropha]
MEKLGGPFVLLVALWGAVNTTLSFFQVINARRDIIFELIDKCGYCLQQTLGPVEIYLTNLLPLSIGNIIFLSLISYVILSIPDHMKLENEEEAKRLKTACNVIAILPVFGALTFFAGGVFDLVMLIRALG